MNSRVVKKPEVNLKFEQITGVNVVSEKEILEKNKSTIGRSAIGGVLLGPLGAIVGGMSGIGTKQDSNTHYYMVVNYRSIEKEIKVLSFKLTGFSNWKSFINELKARININESFEQQIYL